MFISPAKDLSFAFSKYSIYDPDKTLVFKKVSTGVVPVPGEHIAVEERPFNTEMAPPPGGVILQTNTLLSTPF